MSNRKKTLFFLLALFLSASGLFAANLLIPNMQLITRGYYEDGLFKLGSRGDIDFLIEGGYKFGGEIKLNLFSPNLLSSAAGNRQQLDDDSTNSEIIDYINGANYLTFEGAKLKIRELFGAPLDFSFFIGQSEAFCSGDLFSEIFGIPYIGSQFRGYIYFPDSINYNGIHTASGTGFALETDFGSDILYTSLYGYQDAYLGLGYYSIDLDFILNLENFKIESFIGASIPQAKYGTYRGGLLFYYKPSEVGEFLTQLGITEWSPGAEEFNIQLFYLLFEPRINLGFMSIIPTFFWHPANYLQQPTNQIGAMDLNFNFRFGNPEKSPLSGGVEGDFSFGTINTSSLKIIASPYIGFLYSGIQWDIKANFQLFPFSWSEFVEGFIGISAEF